MQSAKLFDVYLNDMTQVRHQYEYYKLQVQILGWGHGTYFFSPFYYRPHTEYAEGNVFKVIVSSQGVYAQGGIRVIQPPR